MWLPTKIQVFPFAYVLPLAVVVVLLMITSADVITKSILSMLGDSLRSLQMLELDRLLRLPEMPAPSGSSVREPIKGLAAGAKKFLENPEELKVKEPQPTPELALTLL